MELAVPIFYDGKVYTAVEIERPRSKVISHAYQTMEKAGPYKGMLEFVIGCVESYQTEDGEVVDDKSMVRTLTGKMPFMTAESVALKIMTTVNKDDTMEGIYPCPRCGEKFIAEVDSVTGEDTRDRVSALETVCMKADERAGTLKIELDDPVKIKNTKTGEILLQINNFELRYPNLDDCIEGTRKFKRGQEIAVQNKVYLNAMVLVNGEEIDRKWKVAYGPFLFDNMYPEDQYKIGNEMKKYGLNKMVMRYCNECGKEWEAPVNTHNFFASGLKQD